MRVASVGLVAAYGCRFVNRLGRRELQQRFGTVFGFFGSNSASHNDTTGSIPQSTPAGHVESRPLPHFAGAEPQGSSGGGQGMASYQPNAEVTGSLPAAPPPPAWTWEGGTPVTVAPGETLEMISRQHGVPVSAIMQANHITSPAMVHAGDHLVIPRRTPSPAAYAPPATRIASTAPGMPVGAPRTAWHDHGHARRGARRNAAQHRAALWQVGHGARQGQQYCTRYDGQSRRAHHHSGRAAGRGGCAARPGSVTPPPSPSLATAESPHSARVATPVAPAQDSTIKTAEPAGGLPSFRWPVRGRIIASFGPTPNGLQNDGINLAVPEGTPVKAAEDGVVAYAGNELKGYGNLVLVRHSNGFVTAYAHASDILVKRGETVKRGQVIAHSGQTGNVTSPQLHFEIRKGSTPVDPSQYLNGA